MGKIKFSGGKVTSTSQIHSKITKIPQRPIAKSPKPSKGDGKSGR